VFPDLSVTETATNSYSVEGFKEVANSNNKSLDHTVLTSFTETSELLFHFGFNINS
jgi:hypothetical protein